MGTIRKGILVLDPRTKILLLLGINIFVFTNSHVCAEMLVYCFVEFIKRR